MTCEATASLPRDIACPVCDRETFHLAKLACQNNVPFFAIRSITDRLYDDIPEDFFHVVDGSGNYERARAVNLLLKRPSLIPAGIRLGLNASVAAKSLGRVVKAFAECVAEPAEWRKTACK